MRRSMLVIAGAIGSVRAVAAALREVRDAVDVFGEPRAGQGGRRDEEPARVTRRACPVSGG
ncbi:hypothetical protein SBADM41S_05738 [Streptomyces badius]